VLQRSRARLEACAHASRTLAKLLILFEAASDTLPGVGPDPSSQHWQAALERAYTPLGKALGEVCYAMQHVLVGVGMYGASEGTDPEPPLSAAARDIARGAASWLVKVLMAINRSRLVSKAVPDLVCVSMKICRSSTKDVAGACC